MLWGELPWVSGIQYSNKFLFSLLIRVQVDLRATLGGSIRLDDSTDLIDSILAMFRMVLRAPALAILPYPG